MRMVVLMEDTCGNLQCACEHGLSVYIDTGRHKLLVDTGASGKTWDNAEKLGISLSEVDTLILSHGHYNHSGGIPEFCKMNQRAAVYMQRTALLDYYHNERYIGIDKEIGALKSVVLLDGDLRIDGEISVFTGITGRKYWPKSNVGLSVRKDGLDIQDSFLHEQCLVVQGKKSLLVSGCAHNGILNILDRYREIYGEAPGVVFSGFHMMKKTDYTEQEKDIICRTAEMLAEEDILFYTGHCTGSKAFNLMKPIMKDKLVQIHCGMEIWV